MEAIKIINRNNLFGLVYDDTITENRYADLAWS